MFGKILKANNYRKSNSILKIDLQPSQNTQIIARQILNSSVHSSRQFFGKKLLENLNCDVQISSVKLKISNTRQWHRKINGRTIFKQYGYYRPKTNYIYIQNLTAVRGKELAPKTFLNTLLHEWLHHYDTEKLKLHSIHTRGFYSRLKSLRQSLGL